MLHTFFNAQTAKDAQTIISYVQSLENLNGAVVLMHSIYESSVQAAAALVAQGLEGEELLLTYADSGGDTLTAGWSAKDNRRREG